jgi:hypothetical protein
MQVFHLVSFLDELIITVMMTMMVMMITEVKARKVSMMLTVRLVEKTMIIVMDQAPQEREVK